MAALQSAAALKVDLLVNSGRKKDIVYQIIENILYQIVDNILYQTFKFGEPIFPKLVKKSSFCLDKVLAIFSCWLVLYGPKRCCMIRAYRCVALDTCLYCHLPILERNFSGSPHGAMELKGMAKRGYLGPLAATKSPYIRSKCVVTMSPTRLVQLAVVWTKSGPLGLSEDLRGPQKSLLGPKRAHFVAKR